MKDLNLNELLRYTSPGVLILCLLYFSLDNCTIKGFFDTVGQRGIFGFLVIISFLLGTSIYVVFRATIYPFINAIISVFFWKNYKESGPINNRKNNYCWTTVIDLLRFDLNDIERASLKEWASQVLYLYVIALTMLVHICIANIFNGFDSVPFLGYVALAIFAIAFFHHYRYKKFELRVILNNH